MATASPPSRPGAPRPGIAERIWDAARTEFSKRGYHGARVQGIARGASCNVALMYRHWASKRALYLDILRSVWVAAAAEIVRVLESGPAAPSAVVGAYLDAMMRDPMGAQILIREYLDGGPHLAQLAQVDPGIFEPVRRAAATLATGGEDGMDPVISALTVGGLAALVASAREAARPFVDARIGPEAWRRHAFELLVNGVGAGRGAHATAGANGSANPSAADGPIA